MRLALLLALSPLLAQAAEQPVQRLPGPETLFSTVLALAFVLLVIFAVAWMLRRMGGLPGGSRGVVKVLGGASVGTRERVVVVEVEDARLVLGVAPGQVRCLHTLPPAQQDFDQELEQAKGQLQ